MEKVPKHYEIVFSHNDLLGCNILKTGDSVRLIDFEYSGYNYMFYDEADYSAESMIIYDLPDWPYFEFHPENMIDLKELVPSEEVKWVEVLRKGSNLMWMLWGVLKYQEE